MFYQPQHFGLSEYFHKEVGENFSFPTHIHHSFEFITILEGSMAVCVGNDKYELKKGEGIWKEDSEKESLYICVIWEDNANPYAYDIVSFLTC